MKYPALLVFLILILCAFFLVHKNQDQDTGIGTSPICVSEVA
jgi:hypothetical protein